MVIIDDVIKAFLNDLLDEPCHITRPQHSTYHKFPTWEDCKNAIDNIPNLEQHVRATRPLSWVTSGMYVLDVYSNKVHVYFGYSIEGENFEVSEFVMWNHYFCSTDLIGIPLKEEQNSIMNLVIEWFSKLGVEPSIITEMKNKQKELIS